VALLHHTERPVDLGQQAGHRRLAGAGVAGEDEVAARLGYGEPALAAHLRHPDQVGHELHLGLDLGQPHEPVELGVELFEGSGRRDLGRLGWSRGRRR
jgi:hypothetical protein